ncbi:MAG: hypothetical protein ACREO5_07760 [Candidatus Binatia bacterium]
MAESKRAIYAAIVGNFAIALTKFSAAAFTGSSAMPAHRGSEKKKRFVGAVKRAIIRSSFPTLVLSH